MISVDHISARVKSHFRHQPGPAADRRRELFIFEWPSAAAISVLCRLTILAVLVLGFMSERLVLA